MAEQIKTKTDLLIVDRTAGWSVTVNENGLAVSVLSTLTRGQGYDLANGIHTALSRLAPDLPPQPWAMTNASTPDTDGQPF